MTAIRFAHSARMMGQSLWKLFSRMEISGSADKSIVAQKRKNANEKKVYAFMEFRGVGFSRYSGSFAPKYRLNCYGIVTV